MNESRSFAVIAVDDDSLVLMNTTAMLEELGHIVFEAASAKEALDILQREKNVNLIITDQSMPGMTGAQLIEAVRLGWPAMPIILASGYAELPPGVASDVMKLAKPFRRDDLAHALAKAVATRRPGSDGAP